MKVFLANIEQNAEWYVNFHSKLKVDFFIPTNEKISEENIKQVNTEKNNADYILYVITPKMSDYFVVAELIDESNKKPAKLLFCFLHVDGGLEFNKHQIKSLAAIGKMVKSNGSKWFETIEDVLDFLNFHSLK